MTRPFDPERHCGAATRNGGRCSFVRGYKTDHPGSGRCYMHGGRTPNGKLFAEREERFREQIDAVASLTLSQIADKLARVAAAGALAAPDADHEDFLRAVNAFAKASERAEGSKVTLEARLAFLANVPDDELDAAIAEAERLISAHRTPAE